MKEYEEIPVRQIMRTDVTEVDGSLDVMEAMRIMKKVGATSLIIKRRHEHDEYGMVLFADIAKKVIAKDRAPQRVNVFEIMAKPVVSVRPNMNIRHCARLFEQFGLSHAPVIENDQVIGMISYYLLVLGRLDLD